MPGLVGTPDLSTLLPSLSAAPSCRTEVLTPATVKHSLGQVLDALLS